MLKQSADDSFVTGQENHLKLDAIGREKNERFKELRSIVGSMMRVSNSKMLFVTCLVSFIMIASTTAAGLDQVSNSRTMASKAEDTVNNGMKSDDEMKLDILDALGFNDTGKLPKLRSFHGHQSQPRPDTVGHIHIYIRRFSSPKTGPFRRIRLPVARFNRRNNPLAGTFFRHIPNVPIFDDERTKQTVVYSRTNIYLLPALETSSGRLFSVAALLASGHASFHSNGRLPSSSVNMLDYYRTLPVSGPNFPKYEQGHGFEGGVNVEYDSFDIPSHYYTEHESYTEDEIDHQGNDQNYRPSYADQYKRRRPIVQPTTSHPTTSGLQSFIDRALQELNAQDMDAILYWNLVVVQTAGNDFDTAVAARPDQPGPTRTSRAFAIIHGAMYEAAHYFHGDYHSLYKLHSPPSIHGVSKEHATDAAIMQAAFVTLYALFPQQRPIFDAVRHDFLKRLKKYGYASAAIEKGILIGKLLGEKILEARSDDGSSAVVPYTPIDEPGYHQVDPLHPTQGFLDPHWGSVRPFVINSPSDFRPPNTLGHNPADRLTYLSSAEYVQNFDEVKSLGELNSATRTADQTEIGITWAYDGAPKLGTPPRLYNQVTRVIAQLKKNTQKQNAALFAMINYCMADSGIAAWYTKYKYNFWRPIVGVRAGGGATTAVPDWEPLGSPSDGRGTDFTPNFPAFVSGHSTFGSCLFESLRLFYKTDQVYFQFQSDEFNGKTIDTRTGVARPAKTRSYSTLSQAEQENAISRIYLGVHWRIDADGGEYIGRGIAKFVYEALASKLNVTTDHSKMHYGASAE